MVTDSRRPVRIEMSTYVPNGLPVYNATGAYVDLSSGRYIKYDVDLASHFVSFHVTVSGGILSSWEGELTLFDSSGDGLQVPGLLGSLNPSTYIVIRFGFDDESFDRQPIYYGFIGRVRYELMPNGTNIVVQVGAAPRFMSELTERPVLPSFPKSSPISPYHAFLSIAEAAGWATSINAAWRVPNGGGVSGSASSLIQAKSGFRFVVQGQPLSHPKESTPSPVPVGKVFEFLKQSGSTDELVLSALHLSAEGKPLPGVVTPNFTLGSDGKPYVPSLRAPSADDVVLPNVQPFKSLSGTAGIETVSSPNSPNASDPPVSPVTLPVSHNRVPIDMHPGPNETAWDYARRLAIACVTDDNEEYLFYTVPSADGITEIHFHGPSYLPHSLVQFEYGSANGNNVLGVTVDNDVMTMALLGGVNSVVYQYDVAPESPGVGGKAKDLGTTLTVEVRNSKLSGFDDARSSPSTELAKPRVIRKALKTMSADEARSAVIQLTGELRRQWMAISLKVLGRHDLDVLGKFSFRYHHRSPTIGVMRSQESFISGDYRVITLEHEISRNSWITTYSAYRDDFTVGTVTSSADKATEDLKRRERLRVKLQEAQSQVPLMERLVDGAVNAASEFFQADEKVDRYINGALNNASDTVDRRVNR